MAKLLALTALFGFTALLPARATAQHNPTVPLGKEDTIEQVVRKAASVTPTPRQLAWQDAEFACFVHFGINTFTDREWGEGTEDPALFNPTALDAGQWVQVCRDAGMRKLILTAKHHDGFCLWPSQYTEHSVKNSPWKNGAGDVVREVSEACREGGLLFGVYLSPWDRHEPTYGDSPKYNEHFVNQLRELLTQYGPIAEVWFDGACGEGPNGKRQVYDWDAYFTLIRELQPDAVISIVGPDVRWCGNEAGETRDSEWSVIPADAGAMDKDLGSRERLMAAAQNGVALKWQAAQVDVSIRPGWFYHPAEDGKVKTLDHLLDIYYGSVGGNSELLLNVPPDRRGLIHENDARRLWELGRVIADTYDENLAAGATATASAVRGDSPDYGADKSIDGRKDTCWTTVDGITEASIEYDLGETKTFNRAMLQEYLPAGQRVEAFVLDAWDGSDWKPIANATVIGYKRLLRFDDVTSSRARVRITASRVSPTLSNFGLFYAPPMLEAPAISRDKAGQVTLSAQPGLEIRYWLSHWPPEAPSKRYTGAFPFAGGGVIKALAIPPDNADYTDAGFDTLRQAEFGIAKAGWRIAAASSDSDPEHPAAAGIDENPDTYWQSKRSPKADELVIDLGQERAITGFLYVPAQDTPKGRVTEYACYVAKRPAEWGAAVAQGSFDNIENNPSQRTVRLEQAVSGRYVRFEARATLHGTTYATAAEFGVLAQAKELENDPAPAMPGEDDWWQIAPETTPTFPERVSDALPLSDQANVGGWEPYAPLTDEFDGDALDASVWWDHNPGWLGRQPAFFSPGNVAVRDGKLHLSMRKEAPPESLKEKKYHTYSSAAVQSKDTVRYGYFEVKAKAMASAGSSSFWFYKSTPPWWTEIDVFEIGGKAPGFEKKHHITVHVMKTPAEERHFSHADAYTAEGGLAEDYHVYGLEWDAQELKFYFDGVLVRRGVNTHWHQPLTLNFDSETMPKWFGLPKDEDLPSTYSVEYVRAWKTRTAG